MKARHVYAHYINIFYNDNGDLAAIKLNATKNIIFSECWGTRWAGGHFSDT